MERWFLVRLLTSNACAVSKMMGYIPKKLDLVTLTLGSPLTGGVSITVEVQILNGLTNLAVENRFTCKY
jgi:hypothetical protein